MHLLDGKKGILRPKKGLVFELRPQLAAFYRGPTPIDTGVFKNAIDWLSRPPEDRKRIFGNIPIGLMGATPGNFGTAFSQYAWLPVLRVLGAQVWSGRLMWVSGAMSKFDEEGNLVDDGVMKQLTKYMSGFTDFVKRMKAFEVNIEDVTDILDSLDFILSGKDNKYRYNVLRCVAEEFKKRL